MDWVEEVILKWKNLIRNSSLCKGLLCTMFLCLIVAVVVNFMLQSVCKGWINVILERYAARGLDSQKYSVLYERGSSGIVEIVVFKFIYFYGLAILIVVTEFLGVFIYMKHQVIPGISAAKEAVGYLELGDYSHEQNYFEKNEVGKVCGAIDNLRMQLIEMKYQEWDAQKELSSINAAFAHDMRTPLTVMKGYTEFLLKYFPQGKVSQELLLEKLSTIYQHEERLLEFSKTMTEIQTIEMRELRCKWCSLGELIHELQITAKEMECQCGVQISMILQEDMVDITDKVILSMDKSLILETFENLLSNGIRYAQKQIEIKLMLEQERLTIFVKDDGKGFSAKALKEAKKLYFSEEKGTSNHFGMGLYICEKLCEKHGGNLSLVNGIDGGAIVAAQFRVNSKSN